MRRDSPETTPRAENTQVPEEEQRAPSAGFLVRLLGLEDSPVKILGWIQNSYTGNTNGIPPSGTNFGVYPNHLADRWQGNQYYLILENALEPTIGSTSAFATTCSSATTGSSPSRTASSTGPSGRTPSPGSTSRRSTARSTSPS